MGYQILHPEQGTPRAIRGVLFDMDGVILDSEKLYARFWSEACRYFGFPMTWEQALGMRSLNRFAGQEYLCSLFGPGIDYMQVKAKRIELMNAFVEQNGIEEKPGIRPLLDYLQENRIPCAVTSSSPPERIQAYLGALGLYDRFDRVCTAYQVPHGKPEPDIYLYGAASLALAPENCLALEDSYTGILSAHRAGCLSVIVPDLDAPGENILSIAFARADSLTDVISLLKSTF